MNITDMQKTADDACALLKALAHPHRLILICQLVDGEKSVGELADLLALRDSTVSQHLSVLRKDGLVASRRDGQTIWYSIRNRTALEVVELLYQNFCSRNKKVKS